MITKSLLLRLLICVFTLEGTLYLYIDRQNDLTELKIQAPKLVRTLHDLEEENVKLRYRVEQLESPERLIKLLRSFEFSHLKYPLIDDVITIYEN